MFCHQGGVTIEGQSLNPRDGFGIWDTEQITVKVDSDAKGVTDGCADEYGVNFPNRWV